MPPTHLGLLTLTCHKDDECHAWGDSQAHHCNSNTKETFFGEETASN